MIQMAKKPNSENVWPKLIWPKYSPLRNSNINESAHEHDLKRFSEQELKQIFIAQLKSSENPNIYYSVETPTLDGYKFSGDYPEILHHADRGQSGNFDLTIYDSNQVIQNHIEFKSGNPERKGITKDLLKLCNEPFCHEVRNQLIDPDEKTYKPGCQHYFIHILDRCENQTLQSLGIKFLHKTKSQNINLPEGLERLKISINECLEASKNCIYVYMLVLNNMIQKGSIGEIQDKNADKMQEESEDKIQKASVDKRSGYYMFKYADNGQVVNCIDWGSCWYKYDGENFKRIDMKDSVKQ